MTCDNDMWRGVDSWRDVYTGCDQEYKFAIDDVPASDVIDDSSSLIQWPIRVIFAF